VLGIVPREAYLGNYLRLEKKITKLPSALGHVVIANQHLFAGFTNQARSEAARAIALQPSDPEAHIAMAWAMITAGNPADGLNFVQSAIRLNPRHSSHYVVAHGIAHYGIGNLKKAARVFEEGIERYPKGIDLYPLAASIFAQLGRRQEARAVVMTWWPGTDQLVLNSVPDGYRFPIKWEHEHRRVRERLFDGLRVAVLPLEITVASLIDDLKTPTEITRAHVTQILGWFGPTAAPAVPDLIEALGDEDRSVRENVIITLGKIGPAAKKAIPALKAIEDEEFLGFYATEALKEIRRN
jgi:adenylate cyclase